jgi:hypothetical protein
MSTRSSKRRAAAAQSWNSIRNSACSRWQTAACGADLSLRLGLYPIYQGQGRRSTDVLIIHDAATYPVLVLKCKPIGVLEVVQTSKGKHGNADDLTTASGFGKFAFADCLARLSYRVLCSCICTRRSPPTTRTKRQISHSSKRLRESPFAWRRASGAIRSRGACG